LAIEAGGGLIKEEEELWSCGEFDTNGEALAFWVESAE
jgi:hypothetical protein